MAVPRMILLEQTALSLKRLLLPECGGVIIQSFTQTGCMSVTLTAEEVEILSTACLPPGQWVDAAMVETLLHESA